MCISVHIETNKLPTAVYNENILDSLVSIAAVACDENYNATRSIVLFNSSVDVGDSTQYHGITNEFLQENGVDIVELVELFIEFVADEFEYSGRYYPIRFMGHNIGTVALPYVNAILGYDNKLSASIQSLDTYSALVPLIGEDVTLNFIMTAFFDPNDYDETHPEDMVLLKAMTFPKIFKQVKTIYENCE